MNINATIFAIDMKTIGDLTTIKEIATFLKERGVDLDVFDNDGQDLLDENGDKIGG